MEKEDFTQKRGKEMGEKFGAREHIELQKLSYKLSLQPIVVVVYTRCFDFGHSNSLHGFQCYYTPTGVWSSDRSTEDQVETK